MSSSLLSQATQAIQLCSKSNFLSKWVLRMAGVSALFAALQVTSEALGASWLFTFFNLFICLGVFNLLCLNTQHAAIAGSQKDPFKAEASTYLTCFLPLAWVALFSFLLGCFLFVDWIPYAGPTLSAILTPFFFLFAALPPVAILLQLLLPLFILPYLAGVREFGMMAAVSTARSLVQQPLKQISLFFLSYAPLVLTLLLLGFAWGVVIAMGRFSPNWSIALVQKSLLIILSGMCLAPATLFLAMMGATQVSDAGLQQQKRPKMPQGRF